MFDLPVLSSLPHIEVYIKHAYTPIHQLLYALYAHGLLTVRSVVSRLLIEWSIPVHWGLHQQPELDIS